MSYDYVVVGSGLFGAVFAQQAKEHGRSVLVLDRRNHIGGNCHSYDYEDTNINVHTYGTHIFHTNDASVWAYVRRFADFNDYRHRVLTTYENRVYTMPINLGTVNAFYGTNLHPWELEQWGCDPRQLPASIITRLPVRTSYQDSYFDDAYQGIPIGGYTPMFQRMLAGIDVELGADYFADRERWERMARRKVVYTGPIDRYFDYAHGRLSWRSVRFELESVDVADYQGTSVMNYADEHVPHTRIHEPRHLHPERRASAERTVTIREYSLVNDDEPYYPVNFESDKRTLAAYEELAGQETHTIFGGRLARYKYYDMHQVVAAARKAAKDELLGETAKAA